MFLFRVFLYQSVLEVKRKIFIPLLLIFLVVHIIIFLSASLVENLYERALIFSKWSGGVNTLLLFIIFSAFSALSWDAIKERKIAQVELSKPISKNLYFFIKFLCFAVIVIFCAFFLSIVSQLLGMIVYGRTFLETKKLSS
ncbi:MAG: hypothetical protein ACK4NF_04565, partial [Planctomycetota bacterium]